MKHHFIVTCSLGFEDVLCSELRRLNLNHVKTDIGSVHFQGKLRDGLKACVWTRLGSRVLLRLHRFQGLSADDLYEGIYSIPWEEHMDVSGSLWIDFIGYSKQLRHSQFAARKAKDAIVDRFRDKTNQRPDVDKDADLRIHVHLRHGVFTVSIDLCGIPLHVRTPNRKISDAPLKENLAACLLHHSGWIKAQKRGVPLIDPLCGSGSIALEAMGIACNAAPNLHRTEWNFQRWKGYDATVWKSVEEEATDLRKSPEVEIYAMDIDPKSIKSTQYNAQQQNIPIPKVICQPVSMLEPPSSEGYIVTNPPYGERIGAHAHVDQVYKELGKVLHQFVNWKVYLLCPANELYQATGLQRTDNRYTLRNGPIKCRFLELEIPSSNEIE
jgi:23S rRNA (guanine2445-N2)-methyltransferase / 23S rRNA (guanine2069-N7)-methyltransferase